jgi:hypothetical protein
MTASDSSQPSDLSTDLANDDPSGVHNENLNPSGDSGAEGRGFRLDLLDTQATRQPIQNTSAESESFGRGDGPSTANPPGAGFLQVYFQCANAYTRATKNREQTAYFTACPKCGKKARFLIGPGGTAKRSFTMSCL